MTEGRRQALKAIGWAAALPLMAMTRPLHARVDRARFPAGRLTLTRVLERGLGDGKALTVTRSWECTFTLHNKGARISARQTDVQVDAPAPLSALADFEKRRTVTGLFPMLLDDRGLIVDWSGEGASIDRAVELAREKLEAGQLAASDRADAARYMAEMGRVAASVISSVPRDLFYPTTANQYEQRNIDLPGGGVGSYELTLKAETQGNSGLLHRSERRIVTRIGGSSRASREEWSIA